MMRTKGKKSLEWDKARAEVKKEFEKLGITYCVAHFRNCTSQVDGFAHLLKRRNLGKVGSEEREFNIRDCVPLCNTCHDVLELMGESIMQRELEQLRFWDKRDFFEDI